MTEEGSFRGWVLQPSRQAVRRACAALGQGSGPASACWYGGRLARLVSGERHSQVQTHSGYHLVPVDVTAFWRPWLRGCPTTHYDAKAGRALHSIPVGLGAWAPGRVHIRACWCGRP